VSPRVSVVLPWCDRPVLRETLARNRDELVGAGAEVVVVNCGGDSAELHRLLVNLDVGPIKVVHAPGPFNKSTALNLGVAASSGEVLCFLDVDIVLAPGFFAEVLGACNASTFATVDRVVEFDSTLEFDLEDDGSYRLEPDEPTEVDLISNRLLLKGAKLEIDLEMTRVHFADGSRGAPGLVALPREAFLEVGGMNASLEGLGWQDLDLVARLTFAGKKRVHAGAAIHMSHPEQVRGAFLGMTPAEQAHIATCVFNYSLGQLDGTYRADVERHGRELASASLRHTKPSEGTAPKLHVVVIGRNTRQWAERHFDGLLSQRGVSFRCTWTDDCSDDGTQEYLASLALPTHIQVVQNERPRGGMRNLADAIRKSEPGEVVVAWDADDFFAHDQVLSLIALEFCDPDVWSTYGMRAQFPTGAYDRIVYEDEVVAANAFRQAPWRYLPPRAFRPELFFCLAESDLQDEDGTPWATAWDLAYGIPMLELAGRHALPMTSVLYLYNIVNPNSDHYMRLAAQTAAADRIRTRPVKKPLKTLPAMHLLTLEK